MTQTISQIVDMITAAGKSFTAADWTHRDDSECDSDCADIDCGTTDRHHCDGSGPCSTCTEAVSVASACRDLGAQAMTALGKGDLATAAKLLAEAASAEGQWGDDPSWGPVSRAMAEQNGAKTAAEMVSTLMGNDGQEWTAPDGRELGEVCTDAGGKHDRADPGYLSNGERWNFADGSSIIAAGDAWDIGLSPDCWCWQGGGHVESCTADASETPTAAPVHGGSCDCVDCRVITAEDVAPRIIFFDSHGAPHITCDASDLGAGAFGPTGTSRPAAGVPHFSEAMESGHVDLGQYSDWPIFSR